MKPFWSNELQDYAVAEMCSCGHLKQDHGSSIRDMPDTDKRLRISHDGNCCNGGCQCRQFNFERYVGKEELVKLIRQGSDLCTC